MRNMRLYKKYIAMSLCAACVLGTSGCGTKNQETEVVNTVDEASDAESENVTDDLTEVISKSVNAGGDSDSAKDETVYIMADASGSDKEVIVSEWLKNPEGAAEITDESTLEDIENVKGYEDYEEKNGKMVWQADGSDIYYQGKTEEKPPVELKVTYFLDGKEMEPEDMLGKQGQVKIRYEYKNNSKYQDVYTPFVMATGVIMSEDDFSNVQVENGRVISDGSRYIVVGMGVPGLTESLGLDEKEVVLPDYFEVEAWTDSFELESTVTVASTNLLKDKDIAEDIDVEEITDEVDDVTQAYSDGMDSLVDGVEKYTEGADKIAAGTGKLATGTETLTDGAGKLSTGLNSAAKGADELKNGMDSAYSGAASLDEGAKKLSDGAGAVKAGSTTLKNGADTVKGGAKSVADGAKTLSAGAAKLSEGTDTVDKGAKSLSAGTKQAYDGAKKVSDGAKQLNDKVQAIDLSGMMDEAKKEEVDPSVVAGKAEAILGTDTTSYVAGSLGVGAIQTAAADGAAYYGNAEGNIATYVGNAVASSVSDCQDVYDSVYASVLESTGDADIAAAAADAARSTAESAVQSAAQSAATSAATSAVSDGGAKFNALATANQTLSNNLSSTVSNVAGAYAKAGSAVTLDGVGKKLGEFDKQLTELKAGTEGLANGTSQVASGLDTLNTGASTLAAGTDSLAKGAGSLKTGSNELSKGAGTLSGGTEQLAAGAKSLETGAASLAEGAGTLKNGTGSLLVGLGKLDDGASTLTVGMHQLDSGASTLYNGTVTLKAGVNELNAGANTLSQNSGALTNGAEQLKQGTVKIIDRMNDAEEKAEDFDKKLKTVKEAGDKYQSFAGISDGMTGEVKFIIKTDAVQDK